MFSVFSRSSISIAGVVLALWACSSAQDDVAARVASDGGAADDPPASSDSGTVPPSDGAGADVVKSRADAETSHSDGSAITDAPPPTTPGIDAVIDGTNLEFPTGYCALFDSAGHASFYTLTGDVDTRTTTTTYRNLAITIPSVAVGNYACSPGGSGNGQVAINLSEAPQQQTGLTPLYYDGSHCEVVISATCTGPGQGTIAGFIHHSVARNLTSGQTRAIEATFAIPCVSGSYTCP